jgi:hypothetical protein
MHTYTYIDSYLMDGKQVTYTGQQTHVVLAEKHNNVIKKKNNK